MNTLVLKLILTPLLIQAATLAGRRWGETVSGWFIGLPLTSGPVALFLALDEGPRFAAGAALGSLSGAAAEAGFCLAYVAVARRCSWPSALAAGSAGFALCGVILQMAGLPLAPLSVIAVAALAVTLHLLPSRGGGGSAPKPVPTWDIPARMAVGTLIVVVLTESAPLLGARLSGLVATYPVFAAVLAIFAHRQQNAAAAERVLRGLLLGLYGFVGFFVALALTIEGAGIAAGFTFATVVALAAQALSFRVMRREPSG